jgi:hypothetical protein
MYELRYDYEGGMNNIALILNIPLWELLALSYKFNGDNTYLNIYFNTKDDIEDFINAVNLRSKNECKS